MPTLIALPAPLLIITGQIVDMLALFIVLCTILDFGSFGKKE